MKKDLFVITVIIPVYNSADYLSTSIKSVLSQTYSEFELILVNDGSTDNSKNIIDEFALGDKRIKTVHKKNGGASSARNAGIEIASGEYLAFIDSDDIVDNGYLSSLIIDIEEFDSPDIIFHGFRVIDLDKSSRLVKPGIRKLITRENGDELLKHLPFLCLSSPIAKVFKADLIRKYSISFNKEINIGEDLVFVMDFIAVANGLVVSPVANYQYDRRVGSLSTTYHDIEEELEAERLIIEASLRGLKNFGCVDEDISPYLRKNLNKHAYRILFGLYNKGKSEYNRKYRIRIVKGISSIQLHRIRRYLQTSSFSGKILSILFNKKIINFTDALLNFLIRRKKV